MTGHRGTGKHWAASTSRVAPKYLRVGSLKVLAYIERSTAQTAMTRIEHAPAVRSSREAILLSTPRQKECQKRWFVVMRRASADDSFTWQPFDHGRQRRMALLFLMVGLCSGLVGLAVGRVPSGVSLESPRAPALKSAVPQRNQTAVTTSTPTPTIAKKTDQIVPPASPPLVLLNPNSEKQATGAGAEGARPPLHPVGPGSPALATTVEKKNDQDVPPANGTAGIGPVPRERTALIEHMLRLNRLSQRNRELSGLNDLRPSPTTALCPTT